MTVDAEPRYKNKKYDIRSASELMGIIIGNSTLRSRDGFSKTIYEHSLLDGQSCRGRLTGMQVVVANARSRASRQTTRLGSFEEVKAAVSRGWVQVQWRRRAKAYWKQCKQVCCT